jgi:hypothetical protein
VNSKILAHIAIAHKNFDRFLPLGALHPLTKCYSTNFNTISNFVTHKNGNLELVKSFLERYVIREAKKQIDLGYCVLHRRWHRKLLFTTHSTSATGGSLDFCSKLNFRLKRAPDTQTFIHHSTKRVLKPGQSVKITQVKKMPADGQLQ